MLIGGLQKSTLIDFPGKIACTVFTVGCNFRCPFCHNPELVDRDNFKLNGIIDEEDFFSFLSARKGVLDGVCVTGGEPMLHVDLPDFLKRIKNLGFLTKLDTNGTNPQMLEKLIDEKLVDYIAMDIKTKLKTQNSKLKTYEEVVGAKVNLEDIKKSIKIIMESGLDYEFRTTVVPGLHTEEDIIEIAKEIRGAKKYYLQQFRPGEKILSEEFRTKKPYPESFFYGIYGKIKDYFDICEVRD